MIKQLMLTELMALADKMAAAHDEMGLDNMGIHHVEAHSALLYAIDELRKCYEREDELIEALQIVRDDLDDVLKGTHLESDGYRHYVVNGAVITKIRNFANDASQ